MLEICPVQAGDRVLDVGCGLGHEVGRLAALTGPRGQVSGVDSNPAMIGEASRRAAEQGLPVTFQVGDAQRLTFADDAFDLCRTERVLRAYRRVAELLDAAVPHPMCLTGRPGFGLYQQLNGGTLDQARLAGEIGVDELAQWWAALGRAAEAGTFFTVNLGILATGTKP